MDSLVWDSQTATRDTAFEDEVDDYANSDTFEDEVLSAPPSNGFASSKGSDGFQVAPTSNGFAPSNGSNDGPASAGSNGSNDRPASERQLDRPASEDPPAFPPSNGSNVEPASDAMAPEAASGDVDGPASAPASEGVLSSGGVAPASGG
ncbi:hypothetical protein T484DRAFT_1884740, partial [Baffinella frigidus]